jgi:hypothetical protein
MYGIVVMVALSSGAQSANGCGWGCGPAYDGGWCGYWGVGCRSNYCCGVVTPAQLGWGNGAPTVSAEEQKKWDDYVASLDHADDRRDVNYLWARADLGARRQLLEKIPPPVKEEADSKEIEKEKPLSAEEIKKWDEYVDSLKGDAKKKAEEDWRKANLAGKRKLLDKVPDKE